MSSDTIHLCGTWPFCAEPMSTQSKKLLFSSSTSSTNSSSSFSLSDLVINIIEQVELNPNQPTVGSPGSVPNAKGIFELDAAWMRSKESLLPPAGQNPNDDDNPTIPAVEGESGAILSFRGFNGAIRFAHQVATCCPHSILAGKGAEEFAMTQFDEKFPGRKDLILSQTTTASTKIENLQQHHQDTLGITAIRMNNKNNNKTVEIIAAVSSSGLGKKNPGRIGDSPLFGSGLYSDSSIGAVAATGDGDCVALFPISFVAVEEMKRLVVAVAAGSNKSSIDTKNIVNQACEYAIQKFLESPNVRAFCNNEKIKNTLSKGGPLIGLCGVCYFFEENINGNDDEKSVRVQTGGACCKNWTYEYVTSHLSFDTTTLKNHEEEEEANLKATIRSY